MRFWRWRRRRAAPVLGAAVTGIPTGSAALPPLALPPLAPPPIAWSATALTAGLDLPATPVFSVRPEPAEPAAPAAPARTPRLPTVPAARTTPAAAPIPVFRRSTYDQGPDLPPVPAEPAAPAVPVGPRVELGFRDGTSASLDPESEQARALEELARALTALE